MKLLSKLAAGFSLGALIVAVPVQAAKEKDSKKEQAAPKRNLSKEFIKAYAPAVDAWQKAKDLAAAKAAFPAAVAAIVNEDDRFEAGVYALNLGIEMKDIDLQKQGIDLLLQSKTTSPEQRQTYLFQKGAYAYDAKDYAGATDFMKQAYEVGFRGRNVELLIGNALGQMKNYAEGQTWVRRAVDSTVAAGGKPDKSWYALGANYALKAKDNASTNTWLKDLIKIDGTPSYWHDALAVYMGGVDLDLSEKLDVVRLMRMSNAMLFEQDYVTYLETVNPARYPNEAYSMLEEGFTSNVISRNSITFAEDWKIAKNLLPGADSGAVLTEKESRANKNNYQTVLGAELFLSRRDYAIARDLYQMALAKGQIIDRDGKDQTDRTLLRMAVSQVGLGDWDGAKASIGKIQSKNRKDIGEYWLIYIENKMAKPAL